MSLPAPAAGAQGGAHSPARLPRWAPASPRLRVVEPAPSTRRRLPFAAVCAAVLALGLVALLLTNIALSRGAYDIQALQRESTQLSEQEQELTERLAAQASPGRLSEQAAALGMVAGAEPGFLRLADGAVLGAPAPAVGAPPPSVIARAAPGGAAGAAGAD